MADTKIKDYMGWEIFQTGDFKFKALGAPLPNKIFGQRQSIQRSNLAALEREIAKRATGRVELMNFTKPWAGGMNRYDRALLPEKAPQKTVVVATVQSGVFRDSGNNRIQVNGLYEWDQTIVDKVQEFIDRKNTFLDELGREYHAWTQSLPNMSVDAAKVERLLTEQQKTAEADTEEAVDAD